MNKKPVLTIVSNDEERADIYLNKEHIIHINHDEHGWEGMKAIEHVATTIATKLGAVIEHTDELAEKVQCSYEAVLREIDPDISQNDLLAADRILSDADLTPDDIRRHVAAAVQIAIAKLCEYVVRISATDLPGVMRGVTVNVEVNNDPESVYKLNKELAITEVNLQMTIDPIAFDVVFSRTHAPDKIE